MEKTNHDIVEGPLEIYANLLLELRVPSISVRQQVEKTRAYLLQKEIPLAEQVRFTETILNLQDILGL